MVYPVVSLRELGVGARAYVEGLEDALIRVAGVHGISARVRQSWCRMFGCIQNPLRWVFASSLMRILAEALRLQRDACKRARLLQGRVKCRTGVWVGDRKLAAIGVRISQGIATHGVALNVATDLSFYQHIVACGISNLKATSLEQLLGHKLRMAEVAEQFADAFRNTFGYERSVSIEPLRRV